MRLGQKQVQRPQQAPKWLWPGCQRRAQRSLELGSPVPQHPVPHAPSGPLQAFPVRPAPLTTERQSLWLCDLPVPHASAHFPETPSPALETRLGGR